MTGVYVYAILAGEQPLDLGPVGLPDGATRAAALPGAGLSALISGYDGPAFNQLPKPALLQALAAHQRVIEQAMERAALLPVKFGTVLASPAEVQTVLDRWGGHLTAALGNLGDAVEIEVVAAWALPEVFAEIRVQPAIAAASAAILNLASQEVQDARIQIGQMVKAALDLRRENYFRQALLRLAPCAIDAQPNALPNDEVVMNVAFLIRRSEVERFYTELRELDDALDHRLTFRCIGPLPPYSFATVELRQGRSAEISAALRLLELGETITEEDLTAAFRRLAGRWHPDRNPGDPEAPQRFAAVAAAHTLLVSCLRAEPGAANGPAHRHDLAQALDPAGISLSIQRSGPRPDAIQEARHEHPVASV